MGYTMPRALALRTPLEKPKHSPLLTTTLLTVEEARAALRVSKWTVYRLMTDRQLETLKIGSRRLIPLDTVEQYIARKLAEGAA
jgi:excisionase family DNA binding protein